MPEPPESSPPFAPAGKVAPVPCSSDTDEISSVSEETADTTAMMDGAEPGNETVAIEGEERIEGDETTDTSTQAPSADTTIKKAPIERKGRMSKKR